MRSKQLSQGAAMTRAASACLIALWMTGCPVRAQENNPAVNSAAASNVAADDAAAEVRKGHHLATLLCTSCHVVASDQLYPPTADPPAPSFAAIAQRPERHRQFIAAISDHDTGWFGESERHAEPGSGRFSKESNRRLHLEPAPGSAERGELTRRLLAGADRGQLWQVAGGSGWPLILVVEAWRALPSAGRHPIFSAAVRLRGSARMAGVRPGS